MRDAVMKNMMKPTCNPVHTDKWFETDNDIISQTIWLFGRRVQLFHCRRSDYEVAVYFGSFHSLTIYGKCRFNIRKPLKLALKWRKTRLKLEVGFFGYSLAIRLGHSGAQYYDFYDSHNDRYYDNVVKLDGVPKLEIKENGETKLVDYPDFQEVKVKPLIKTSVALPFSYTFNVLLHKPYEYREWLGCQFDIDFSEDEEPVAAKLMLAKFELKATVNKDEENEMV